MTEQLPDIARPDPRSVDPTPLVLSHEHAFLGCVLRCPTAAHADNLLARVANEDFADPFVRGAIEFVRMIVADGEAPHPAAVLVYAARLLGEHQRQLLGRLMFDSWLAAPPSHGEHLYTVAVLEASYRRAGVQYAQRVQQAADGPLDLYERILGDREAIRAVWARLRAATGEPTNTKEVGVA
jgi:hypothetical protein